MRLQKCFRTESGLSEQFDEYCLVDFLYDGKMIIRLKKKNNTVTCSEQVKSHCYIELTELEQLNKINKCDQAMVSNELILKYVWNVLPYEIVLGLGVTFLKLKFEPRKLRLKFE